MEEHEAVSTLDAEPETVVEAGEEVEAVHDEPGGDTASDTVRELIVKAYPEVVPELIQGTTLEEMLATLPAAQAAYQNIASELRAATPEPVPSGGGIRSRDLDLDLLSPEQMIKAGLKRG